MKFEARIEEHAAKIEVSPERLYFFPESAPELSREFAGVSVVQLAPGAYSVLLGERSFEAVFAGNGEVFVNGRSFQVEVFDPREMRARRGAGAGEGRQNIKAMMPGKVIRVLVGAGDAIAAGQGLIVVEAMKMQNEMKSPKAGRVVDVKVKPDATVAAGEVLLVIE